MTTQTTTPETVSIVERTRQPVVVLDIDGPVAELGRLVNDALERAASSAAGPPSPDTWASGPRSAPRSASRSPPSSPRRRRSGSPSCPAAGP